MTNRPQVLRLGLGQTAHLSYSDVTVLRVAARKDGISQGIKAEVCYAHAHDAQNADGSTRVSRDPWSIQVRDGEGGNEWTWATMNSFPADRGWSPSFDTTTLRIGQCEKGWIAVRHDTPDLQFGDVRYQSANFGDDITWDTSATR